MTAAKSPDYKYLREIWDDKDLAQAVLEASPTIGLLPKDESFTEKKRYITVGYGSPQGVGATYTGAKFAKKASPAAEFAIEHKHYHATFSIDGFLFRQAKFGGNKAVLLDPIERESTRIIEQVKRDFSKFIHGNGGGSLGRLTAGTTVSSTTGVLTNLLDGRFFEQGMLCTLSTADGTSGSEKAGYIEVSSVQDDGSTSQVIFTGAINAGIPTAAASDYVFRYDTFGSVMAGIGGWLPNWSNSSLPGTFKGQDRNLNPRRLAGNVVAATTLSPRQAVLRAARVVSEAGGKPDLFICSTAFWELLANELQAAGSLSFDKAPAEKIGGMNFGISYEGINVMGPRGRIMVVADPDMQSGTAWMLTKSSWVIASMGPLVHWNHLDNGKNDQGGGMLEDGADAVEFRLVSDHEVICKNPFVNARVSVAA